MLYTSSSGANLLPYIDLVLYTTKPFDMSTQEDPDSEMRC
jgi:hypothetical protein